MSNTRYFPEEDDTPNVFSSWLKNKFSTVEEDEFEGLTNEQIIEVKKRLRDVSMPNSADRQILYTKYTKGNNAILLNRVLVTISAIFTFMGWFIPATELLLPFFLGLVFAGLNILYPEMARYMFWRGGGVTQIFVNLVSFLMMSGAIIVSFMASIALYSFFVDTNFAEAERALASRTAAKGSYDYNLEQIIEKRKITKRTPLAIQIDLDDLLAQEPKPVSQCLSPNNRGSWSKANCSKVTAYRTELRASKDIILLVSASVGLKKEYDKSKSITKVDTQASSISKITGYSEKGIRENKPIVIGAFWEFITVAYSLILALVLTSQFNQIILDEYKDKRKKIIRDVEDEFSNLNVMRNSPDEFVHVSLANEESDALKSQLEAQKITANKQQQEIDSLRTASLMAQDEQSDLQRKIMVNDPNLPAIVKNIAVYSIERLSRVVSGYGSPRESVWNDYSAWCNRQGLIAGPASSFNDALARAGIRVVEINKVAILEKFQLSTG